FERYAFAGTAGPRLKVGPEISKIYGNLIGAVLRTSFAHLIGETGAAPLGGAICVGIRVRYRPNRSITVDVNIGRGSPVPEQINCVKPVHLVAIGSQRDRTRASRLAWPLP